MFIGQIQTPPVYLVDDDVRVCESTEFLLGTIGIPCRTFHDGASFLEKIPELPDGCLLIDRLMPRLSGLEVIHRLIALHRKMPVILMTGATNAAKAPLVDSIGPHTVLEKPFAEDVLLTALEHGFEQLSSGPETDTTNAEAAVAHLTALQIVLLRGLIAGLDTAALAVRLDIAETVVRRNRVALKARIAASDVHHAIAIGQRAGLLPLRPDDLWAGC